MKSTFLRCLLGLQSLSSGSLKVNNIELVSSRNSLLFKSGLKISYVPQDEYFPNGSLRQFILGSDVSLPSSYDKLFLVYRLAELDFLGPFNEIDWDLFVTSNGSCFSGGERQRLSIARAMSVIPQSFS